jgi:ABC-type branched-subunit amino acid transport system substrate-binding protein
MLSAQHDAESVYEKAIGYYKRGAFDSTVAVIRRFIKKDGKAPETRYLVPLLIEASLREQEVGYARKLFAVYIKKFPDSPYVPRVWYLEGMALCAQSVYDRAIRAFSKALELGVSPALDSLIVHNVGLICTFVLTPDEMERLVTKTDLHPKLVHEIAYHGIVKLEKTGRWRMVKKAADVFLRAFPRSPYEQNIRRIMSRAESGEKNQISIGVLVPLSGYNAEIGRQVAQGIELAIREYNNTGAVPVKQILYDTRGNSVETIRLTRKLIDDHEVDVIVGPVLSQTAVVSAAILAEKNVVMLSPTATDRGIAQLGDKLFQMNVTLDILGRSVAEYAMKNMKITEFACLIPWSEYGEVLSKCFKEYVETHGGEIVAEEYFDEGANDFRPQFISLRQKLARRYWEKRDGLLEMDSKHYSRSAKHDSVFLADSVIAVGGLFIPAETDDVVMLAPQVYFHRIQTQMLGSTGWHTPETILDGKKYVNDAIISTNFTNDPTSREWKEFRSSYHKRFQTEPDRPAALGYDAAELICNAIKENGTRSSAESIAHYLKNVEKYRGISGFISFDPEKGVNTETAILKISNRKFIRVQ